MLLSSLRYKLDPANIATEPRDIRLGRRDLGRMLVVDRATSELVDSYVQDFGSWLSAGDVLVLNDSKRLPGVLKGRVDKRAKVDVRLVSIGENNECLASVSPMHFVDVGTAIYLRDDNILVVEELNVGPHKLSRLAALKPLPRTLANVGLPITSFFYTDFWCIEHYNPVYSKRPGSVESPMAGLHFTAELLSKLESMGVIVRFVTLHVVGSWLPPLGSDTSSYAVYPEPYSISAATAKAINRAKAAGNRIVAVGSTVVRALESSAMLTGSVTAITGMSELFISPGHKFHVVDCYFTNFHPAQSGLMALDAALCPKSLLLKSYSHANKSSYMFLEFGDAVFYI